MSITIQRIVNVVVEPRRLQSRRSAKLGATSLVLCLAGSFGCDGISAPDGGHTVLRISRGENRSLAGQCDGHSGDETGSVGSPDTWILYGVADNGVVTPYLDTGSDVFSGGLNGVVYTFKGNSSSQNDMGTRIVTKSEATVITLNTQGKTITGSYGVTNTESCSGQCNNDPTVACTTTRSLVGVVIDRASDAP